MKLAEPRVTVLLLAAALHEVGRLSSPSENGDPEAGFSGAWTSSDALAAERILAPIDSLRAVREIILHSPDCLDAAPLPFGSDRPGIPLESRILGTCEEFVRLTPPNGKPEQAHEALRTIRKRVAGGHDPEVVAALCRVTEGGGVR